MADELLPADDAGWKQKNDAPTKDIGDRDLKVWLAATKACREFALAHNLSRTDVARRAAVSVGTLYQWYDGNYVGNYSQINARIEKWLAAEIERQETAGALIKEPEFVMTPTAKRVSDMLLYAQEAPAMVLITLGPGMGKTRTARHVMDSRLHVFRVVMSPSTAKMAAMMRAIAMGLGVSASTRDTAIITKGVGERLRRNGRKTLLIVDEAQNLIDQAVDELRHLFDEYQVGIALLGNEDLTRRFGGQAPREGYGQLHRRIGGRIRQLKPTTEDIDTYVDAWGLDDPDILKLARSIGRKPGALGQIVETFRYANIIAAGRGRDMTADDVRAAWINRSGEDLH